SGGCAAISCGAARVSNLSGSRPRWKPSCSSGSNSSPTSTGRPRVYHALMLPVKVFTPIFVVARTSGWAAHVIEQVGDNRLIRPLSAYCGPAARNYVPLSARPSNPPAGG
ncbi:MAG: hypothetical protein FJ284_11200, partial [Planctomycetes bacterium]|nr:hypothetical protein [Planctomycetota bacterium]